MLDINLIRTNPDAVRKSLEKRQDTEKVKWLDDLAAKDREWRSLLQSTEQLRRRRNEISREINELKQNGKDTSAKISEAKKIPETIKQNEHHINELREKIRYYLMRLPNILEPEVPAGKDDTENKILRKWGKLIKPKAELLPHGEFLESIGGADFENAAKVSGRGFYYLLGEIALLDQALMQFAIHELVKKKYTLVYPPHLMRRKPYEGVTDLGDFETMMYKIQDEELYLIATSEHPIAARFMDKILDASSLPLKFAGTSVCFRKEIGSHGVDERGLFRLHQFNKIEQFIFCKPEDSGKYHEELIKNAESIFQALKLPYRIVDVCTGDIGTVAARKFDLEVWMPRENKYREAASCSNCTSYQSIRLNIKYRKTMEDKQYVHTLNSTAIATNRAIKAIVESFQQTDGTVKIPKVLLPYMHGVKEISPAKPKAGKKAKQKNMNPKLEKANKSKASKPKAMRIAAAGNKKSKPKPKAKKKQRKKAKPRKRRGK